MEEPLLSALLVGDGVEFDGVGGFANEAEDNRLRRVSP